MKIESNFLNTALNSSFAVYSSYFAQIILDKEKKSKKILKNTGLLK